MVERGGTRPALKWMQWRRRVRGSALKGQVSYPVGEVFRLTGQAEEFQVADIASYERRILRGVDDPGEGNAAREDPRVP